MLEMVIPLPEEVAFMYLSYSSAPYPYFVSMVSVTRGEPQFENIK